MKFNINNRFFNVVFYPFLVLFLTVVLSGCGGGGGGGGSSNLTQQEQTQQPEYEQQVVVSLEGLQSVTVAVGGSSGSTSQAMYYQVMAVDGNMYTIRVEASVFSPVTILLSELTTAMGTMIFSGELATNVVEDINGQIITLDSTTINYELNQSLELTFEGDTTITVLTENAGGIAQGLIISTIAEWEIEKTITSEVIATVGVTSTVSVDPTITLLTLTLAEGDAPPSGVDVITVVTATITETETKEKIDPDKILEVTVVEVNRETLVSITSVYFLTLQGESGSQSSTSGKTFVLQNEFGGQYTLFSSGNNFHVLASALPVMTITISDGQDLTEVITLTASASTTYIVAETVVIMSTMTITSVVGSEQVVVNTVTVTTANTITLYGTYAKGTTTLEVLTMTLTVAGSTVKITVFEEANVTMNLGMTIAYNSSGSLAYVNLPPPNSSDGKNYKTGDFNNQYGLGLINVDKAYQRGYFGQGVTVGIVDSGILTSHVDLSANIVEGRRSNFWGNLYDDIYDADGHGTHVAGIVGAIGGNGGSHGVAPLVSIMPLQMGDENGIFSGDHIALFRYAVEQNVPILNNSWGSFTDLEISIGNESYTFSPALGHEFISSDNNFSTFKAEVSTVADLMSDSDMVMVWAAGNDGWNSETGEVYVYNSTITTSFSTEEIIRDGIVIDNGEQYILSTMGISLNYVSGVLNNAPLYDERLLGKWVDVVATDANNSIASFSNGCGDAMYWCLAAPGVNILSPISDNDNSYDYYHGTSMAAPHVSGALAVLRSRFIDMPMNAVLAILFHTAQDLGEEGVDAVYGHGLVDLDAATALQGSVNLVIPGENMAGIGASHVSRSSFSIPYVLYGMSRELDGISIAVNFMGDYYYDMPINGLISDITEDTLPELGEVASDMQEESAYISSTDNLQFVTDKKTGQMSEVSYAREGFGYLSFNFCETCAVSSWKAYDTNDFSRPFFSESQQEIRGGLALGDNLELFFSSGLKEDDIDDREYQQYGLRWKEEISDSFDFFADISRINEEDTFLGGEFKGAFSLGDTQTYQGELQLSGELNEDWQAYGSYLYGLSNADTVSDSAIYDVSDIRFDGWKLGLRGLSVFTADDVVRFGITRHSGIRSGNIGFRYGATTGDAIFNEDLHLYLQDEVSIVDQKISLLGEEVMTWQFGYLLPIDEDSALSFGVEQRWRELSDNDTAFSFAFSWNF